MCASVSPSESLLLGRRRLATKRSNSGRCCWLCRSGPCLLALAGLRRRRGLSARGWSNGLRARLRPRPFAQCARPKCEHFSALERRFGLLGARIGGGMSKERATAAATRSEGARRRRAASPWQHRCRTRPMWKGERNLGSLLCCCCCGTHTHTRLSLLSRSWASVWGELTREN